MVVAIPHESKFTLEIDNYIHSRNLGGLGPTESNVSRLTPSPWKSVRSLQNNLSCMNINLHTVFVKKVGNGSSLFWDETWYGVHNFKSMFPRLYSLESQKSCKVSDRCIGPFPFNWAWMRHPKNGPELVQYNSLLDLIREFSPSSSPDHWECSLDASKIYQVHYTRKKINGFLLCSNDDVVRWNNTIPIKVNIHSWCLSNDRLPTRCNLDARGIDLDSTRCPLCDQGLENAQHLFVDCSVASNLWSSVKERWRWTDYPKSLSDLLSWGDLVNFFNNIPRTCIDAVVQTTFWVIWQYPDRVCFDIKPPRKYILVQEIKILSYAWFLNRNSKIKPVWIDWIDDFQVSYELLDHNISIK